MTKIIPYNLNHLQRKNHICMRTKFFGSTIYNEFLCKLMNNSHNKKNLKCYISYFSISEKFNFPLTQAYFTPFTPYLSRYFLKFYHTIPLTYSTVHNSLLLYLEVRSVSL